MTEPKNTTLRIVCMYCGKIMGEKPGYGVSGDSHSICKACWEERFPGEPYPEERSASPSTLTKYDNAVRHLGYDPGSLSEDEKLRLVQESQWRLAGVKPIPDSNLSPAQLSSLSLARAIARSKVSAADIPAASDRVRTAGMYSRSTQEIYISQEQLERGREAVSTVIHELAHHTSGAEDGETKHTSEIANLSDRVVAATKHGDYDRYLSGTFTW